MNILVIILRLVHILAGVFWVGGALFVNFVLGPAAAATGEAGQKMMGYLVRTARMSARFMGAAGLTVLAGAALYWIDSDGLRSSWTHSGAGWGFGIGAIFAVIGLVFGARVGTASHKLTTIASAIQGSPTQAQMLDLQATQKQMQLVGIISSVALIIALACMATARYWGV